MTLHTELSKSMKMGMSKEFFLTIVFREINDEGETYFVGECLELPGCVSEGATEQEAQANMRDAVESCLSVIIEDTMKQILLRQAPLDYTGISSQERMKFNFEPKPCLEYAYDGAI